MQKKEPFDFSATLKRLSGKEDIARVAFQELVEHFAPNIYYSAKKILKSQAIAEDLMQEVLTAVWEKRMRLTHVNNFEHFLYGMTKRMAFEQARKAVNAEIIKRKHLEKMERQEDPFKEKYARQLDELVEKLPSPKKEIFQLVKIEGLEGKVVAERFNITVNAVRLHVSKAMKIINAHKHDVTTLLLLSLACIQRLIGL